MLEFTKDELKVVWGCIEDYYPDPTPSQRENHDADGESWIEKILDEDYEEAHSIEMRWGDDPATQRVISMIKKIDLQKARLALVEALENVVDEEEGLLETLFGSEFEAFVDSMNQNNLENIGEYRDLQRDVVRERLDEIEKSQDSSIINVIEKINFDGQTLQGIIDALEDGQFLGECKLSQKTADALYSMVIDSLNISSETLYGEHWSLSREIAEILVELRVFVPKECTKYDDGTEIPSEEYNWGEFDASLVISKS